MSKAICSDCQQIPQKSVCEKNSEFCWPILKSPPQVLPLLMYLRVHLYITTIFEREISQRLDTRSSFNHVTARTVVTFFSLFLTKYRKVKRKTSQVISLVSISISLNQRHSYFFQNSLSFTKIVFVTP